MVSSPHDLIQYVHSNCLFVQKKAPQNLHLRDKEKSIFENPKNLRICSYSYALVCSSFESPHHNIRQIYESFSKVCVLNQYADSNCLFVRS